MSTGWSVLDALNKSSKAGVDDTPKARFRTRDISIRKIYTNDRNFYSVSDVGVERLAQEILAAGLIENMTVAYAPCERGEYRLIAGERRFRALQLLVERGHDEFETATCQVKAPAEEHEEMVQIILANGYREKTVADVLNEEKHLKEALQYMKANGLKLSGYDLNSGRLRDTIAAIMNTTPSRIAQIEGINNRLISEAMEEVNSGRLTFSAAYELSGMDEDGQRRLLERLREAGELTWTDVKAEKKTLKEPDTPKEDAGAEETEAGGNDTQGAENATEGEQGPEGMFSDEEYFDPKPEREASLCYSCARYTECHEKREDVRACNAYIDKAEADKTPEQRYDEEQAAIDRQTKKAIQEREQEQRLDEAGKPHIRVHRVKIGASFFKEVKDGEKGFELRKNDRDYQIGDVLQMMEYSHGAETGEFVFVKVTYMLEGFTGLQDGYAILQIAPFDPSAFPPEVWEAAVEAERLEADRLGRKKDG